MIRIPASAGFAVLAIAAGLAVELPAWADGPPTATTAIRTGDHPGFGRIVFDTSARAAYQVDQTGDHVTISFASPVSFADPPPVPRNVLAITIADHTIELTLKPGSSIRAGRPEDRFVIDVLDPGRASATKATDPAPAKRSKDHTTVLARSPELGGRRDGQASPAQPAPAAVPAAPVPAQIVTAPVQPVPVQVQPSRPPPGAPPGSPGQPAPPLPEVNRQQQTSPVRVAEADRPIALLARRVKLPREMNGSGFLVPFSDTTGAAAFREGDTTYVVFDERRPIDMASLRGDAVFGQASVQTLPNGTLLSLPLPPSLSVALTQTPQGWRIAALAGPPKMLPIAAIQAAGSLKLSADQVGDVVNMADPDTGATLFIGTQRRPGQAVTHPRLATEFILRATMQGVVIEPLSDAIVLKPTPTGFSLGNPAGSLALSDPAAVAESVAEGANLTRRLHFPGSAPDTLLRRLSEQANDSGMMPPGARGPKRRTAAESMIGLGMDAEAEGLLQMAAEQDPKEAASPDALALTAIAALLAGRVAEATGLDDPRLTGTDEIALWRAVREAMKDPGSPNAAAVFATTAPLAASYPPAIRDRILPLILETMIDGGEIAPAARLLDQRPDDPLLAYARAMRVQADGQTDKALGLLDALANGRDQNDRARAAVRAVELRLAARQIDKAQAATALDKLLYAWRGDDRELRLRERVATLRAESGGWRQALAMLRQAEADFPDQGAAFHERLKDTFAGMTRDPDTSKMTALDYVSMVDENADLINGPEDQDAIAQPLADRLMALDLPDRAKPVLEKLMRSATSDAAKARLGASVAALDTQQSDDAGTLAVLDASEAPGLPADLAEQRGLLRANAMARRGDAAGGAAVLAAVKTGPAAAARAQILENSGDWQGAAQAWSDCAGLTVPDNGPLDEPATRTVLRLTTATARATDQTALAGLRAKYADRIGGGPLGDMFRLLTEEPVRTSQDLGRSKQEMDFAVSLPAGMKALQAGPLAR